MDFLKDQLIKNCMLMHWGISNNVELEIRSMIIKHMTKYETPLHAVDFF